MTAYQPTYNTQPESADSDNATGMNNAKSVIRQTRHPSPPCREGFARSLSFPPLSTSWGGGQGVG